MQKYLWWRDFLDAQTVQEVRNVAKQHQAQFVPTTVSTGVPDYRKSTVLWHYNYMPLYEKFTAKLRQVLPHVMQAFDQHFIIGNIEMQMTASGNGEYFKAHTDNGTPDTDGRRITYVYYFLLTEPKQFSGGELVIDNAMTIQPNHNSIVWFPSEIWHEVMPVQSSGQFLDSRLTINGWVRSA